MGGEGFGVWQAQVGNFFLGGDAFAAGVMLRVAQHGQVMQPFHRQLHTRHPTIIMVACLGLHPNCQLLRNVQ